MKPRRISIVGNSGSGKSTAGKLLADALGGSHLELDSIRHQPGWQELPDDEFRRRVVEFTESNARWVVDGNYSVVQPDVWARADTVVWLDLPKFPNMVNIVKRTLGRTLLRKELWNGNRESLTNLLSLDPYENIIVWAWTRHATYRQRYLRAAVDSRWRHLDFVILRSRDDAASFAHDLRRR